MGMGPITVVQNDSPAEKAGLAPGDLITQLDGKPTALTHDDLSGWTPMTLPEYLHKAALEDREVEITVQRKASGESDSREVSLRIKPVVPIALSTGSPLGAPMAADAIGIAYQITNSVQAVVPSGPASATKIAAGDRVTEAKIIYSADDDGKIAEPITVKLDDEHRSWPGIIDSLQFEPDGTRVELSFLRGDDKEPQKLTIQPKPVEGVYLTARGLQFEPIFRVRKAASFSEAVRYGWEETTDALTMVVRFLQKLGGQVPFKMLGGPGTIAVAAGGAADQGLASLLIFLTMLSANLAVINFLPIPLLDGGHMVFLAYEGIRGRPANEKFVLALHMAGFVFIIGLMIFVIGLDIQRWWPT
jgi:regulator of sigma E protease